MSYRMKRVPFSEVEDDSIRSTYAHANGGFPTYASQAEDLNRRFHEGRKVRSANSVRRRECKLLIGKR